MNTRKDRIFSLVKKNKRLKAEVEHLKNQLLICDDCGSYSISPGGTYTYRKCDKCESFIPYDNKECIDCKEIKKAIKRQNERK